MKTEIQVIKPEEMQAAIAEIDESNDSTGLAEMWLKAKAVEDAATAVRSHIGKKLAILLPVPEGQKSKTHTCGDFKVGVKPRVNYKVEWQLLAAGYARYLAEHLKKGGTTEDAIAPPYEMVPELKEKALHWIRENAKELYDLIVPAITATPGTTGIEVEHKPKKVTNG